MIGKIISHYKILKKLGEGGMGEVYLAHDEDLDRDVALKLLPLHFIKDQEIDQRFRLEARAAARLNHPNIITVYEIAEQEGQVYIAMEYVDGHTLREEIAKGPMAADRVVEIARQLCNGLDAAHKAGIVHRDIKPENIIIDHSERIRILDFGLAKLKSVNKLTREHSTLGTTHYLSPEQVRGESVDHQTDLWSLGVVLYEMLAGDVPFKGEYEQAVFYSILNEEVRPVQDARDNVPENLASVVGKLLRKDKGRRYRQSDDVISDLKGSGNVSVQHRSKNRKRFLIAVLSAAAALICLFTIRTLFRGDLARKDSERKMLAVLPFENLGPEDDAYFVNGMTDAITARLAQLQGLGVISRQSTIQYKNSKKQISEIGKELGVAFILQGTIQRERPSDPQSRTRVIPQLVNVSEDVQLWTRSYENEMNDIFTVQSEIAEKVAEALDIRLLKADREINRRRSTENLQAYEMYLRGTDVLNRGWAEEDLRKAGKLFSETIAMDSSFALAYAMLSRVHCFLFREYFDRNSARLEQARAAAEKALALDENSAEAHLSLGYCCYLDKRMEQALKEYETVRLGQPSNADVYSAMAFLYRVQGKLDKAIPMLERAVELDPYNHVKIYELAITNLCEHRYAEAERVFDRVIAQVPDWFVAYLFKSILYMSWRGDSLNACTTMKQAAEVIGTKALVAKLVYMGSSGIFRYLDEPFLNTLDSLTLKESGGDSSSFYLAKSVLHMRRAMPEMEKMYMDSARSVLENLIESGVDDAYFHALLGTAYAKLGRQADALREMDCALTMIPVAEDVWTGTDFLWMLVEVHLSLGEYEKAIDEIEKALTYPGIISRAWIRIDQTYAPLHVYPRFQRLIDE